MFCVVLVAVLGAGAYLLMERAPEPVVPARAPVVAPEPTTAEVFAPRRYVTAGTILTGDQLRTFEVEKALLNDEMIVADEAGREFVEGVPIARSAVIHPGDRGFLAAVLPKGRRAISIEITEVAGVSGLAVPGDYVDVILTYMITAEQGDFERDIHASETVISNIRVLALDQRLQAARQEVDKHGVPVPPPVASTATLEVTPRQAEMILLASRLGTLSLAAELRPGRAAGGRCDGRRRADGFRDADGTDPEAAAGGSRGTPAGLLTDRPLTMDTDVTTLLARLIKDAAEDHPLDVILRLNNIEYVQVVRGRRSNLRQIGGDKPEEENTPGDGKPPEKEGSGPAAGD